MSNKPLIIITAALSLAVITLSIQVIFLTFSVKDQKDALRYISSSTDVHTIQNKINGLQNNMVNISRELESLRADSSRLSAEVSAMTNMMSKSGQDFHFLQQELTSFDARITSLEQQTKSANATILQMERNYHAQQQ